MKVKVKYTAERYTEVEIDDDFTDIIENFSYEREDEIARAVRKSIDVIENNDYTVNEVTLAENANGYTKGFMLYEYY